MQRYFQVSLFLYARLWPLNAVFSLAGLFFIVASKNLAAAYILLPFVKAGGYAGSLALHYVRASRTHLFYRNMGFSMRSLFAGSLGIDLCIFLVLAILAILCRR
ncbi:hypothetical protein [Pedobacter yulinensis]|uniref:hypothetical protein n=1 Tax=Pedobacter yulinensis TaxID=2126353 RepID=UPI0013A6773A|nr:hypothetical protein [Pedobacter yulinensis]